MNDETRDEPMIDLPLGIREEPAAEPVPAPGPEDGAGSGEGGARGTGPRGRRMAMAVLGGLALLVLLALAVLLGYLLPRPGPPVLRVEPAFADFGKVRVGQSGDVQDVTLTSAGDRPVQISDLALSGPTADEFRIAGDACSGVSLESHESCVVALRFAPTVDSLRRAALEIPSDASNGRLSVPLTGTGVAPRPAVDRSRVEFAPLPAGSRSEPEVVVLSNRGTASYPVPAVSVTGKGAADFAVAADRCTGAELDPGGECTVGVVFGPSAAGESRATLRFGAGGGSAKERRGEAAAPSVELAGTALEPGEEGAAAEAAAEAGGEAPAEPARLTIEPARLDLGAVRVGTKASSRPVVVHNVGGAPAPIDGVAVTGATPAAFVVEGDRCTGNTLGPDERCTVAVSFRPTQEGDQRGELEIRSEAVSEAPKVPLSGAGTAPHLSLGATQVSFGEVRVTARARHRLTLTSSGRAPLEVRGLAISGPAAQDFRVVDDPCSKSLSLAPEDHCTLTLEMAPTEVGERRATLVIRHDGPGSPEEVALAGTALPAPAPAIAHRPAAVAFGDQPVGERSAITTVEISNPGTARLVLRSMALAGANPEDFRIVPGSCEGAPFLVPESTCTVGIRFVPSAAGGRRARLLIRHNAEGGTEEIGLTGQGVPANR